MNPLTNVKNIKKLSEQELHSNSKTSWHDEYKDSAWIFIGGLPYDLTEGDVICVFSQYGEIVNINLVREKESGKSKGFCFICYEDQRSTTLSVDNLNGTKILGRTIRVDHVKDYKTPRGEKKLTAETLKLIEEGCLNTPVTQPGVKIKEEPPDNYESRLTNNPVPPIKIKQEIKQEPSSRKKHSNRGKESKRRKKDKSSKKEHNKKSKKRRKSSSSDSDSTQVSSESDSD